MVTLFCVGGAGGHFIDEAQIDHRTVGYNHDFFAVFHVLQVLDGIALEIDFGGYFEPFACCFSDGLLFDV